ncbi:hypothetical protein [Paenibacillus periandrae]|uniref:hypothetical protein n=1 Tax=Paenibacillus periandrae TaxID=1761741 RepID=UPI001F08F734|nr:hypothetical protein [Paenibacillus periandrae]
MKKVYLLIAALFLLNVIQLFHGMNLKAQIKDQISATGADDTNKAFIEKFFTYETTKQRYDNIKPFMTTRGYNSALPAGIEIPDNSSGVPSVSSQMNRLQPFRYVSGNEKIEFMNGFDVVTSFNKVQTTQTVIVHTVLLYSKDKGWQVDEVEFVGTFGNANASKRQ